MKITVEMTPEELIASWKQRVAQLTEEVHNDERKIAINRAAIATLVACIHDFEASVKLKK
mgnify:CR=1 FL=1